MLFCPRKLDEPECFVPAADYYRDRHQLVAAAIHAIFDRNGTVDTVTVAEELGDRLGEIGGADYLNELLTSVPHAESCAHYAAIVREHAVRRRVIFAAAEADRIARDTTTPLDELQDRLAPILNGKRRAQRVAVVRPLSDYPAESIEWIWPSRIPLGKFTLVSGDPGEGKSFSLCDLTARITTGKPWPDCPGVWRKPATVIMFNAEDDPRDTVRPRIERAGGDPDRVLFVEGVVEAARQGRRPKQFSLSHDMDELDALVARTADVALITIDPLGAYCGAIDSHRDNEVRSAIGPLAEMAARHRVGVVGVAHLNKSGGTRAIYKTLGSIGFTGAARVAWLVGRDQQDPLRRIWAPVKCNIIAEPTAMAFRIVDGLVEWEPEPFKLHGDEMLAAAAADPSEAGDRTEAEAWLLDHLRNGPSIAGEVIKAAEKDGITGKSLRTARERLCHTPQRRDGHWYWQHKSTDEDLIDAAEGAFPP